FFSSRRRHTRSLRDWSSDVCSSDLAGGGRCLAIGIRIVEDGRPQSVGALAGAEGRDLRLQRRDEELANSVTLGQIQQLDEVRDRSEERRVGKECRCGWLV